MYLVICNNTKEKFLMAAQENECQISQNYILHKKFSEFYLCFHSSCEIIWHSFSRAPMRNFLWCYYRWLTTSLALKKCKKNAILFKLFWYKVFVHWKIKLLNFLMDSVLIYWSSPSKLYPHYLLQRNWNESGRLNFRR